MTSPGKVPIAVFVSGIGSNLQALMQAESRIDGWPARIALVVSDKPDCPAVAKAKAAGLPVCARLPRDFTDKSAFEQAILTKLYQYNVEWLFLAGYMRLLGSTLLDAYRGKIVNIHPSLLPAFPGKHAIAEAVAAGVKETGVTVHFVDEGIDTGDIIAQQKVAIEPGMTEEDMLKRVHEAEHELYPRVVRQLLRVNDTSVN